MLLDRQVGDRRVAGDREPIADAVAGRRVLAVEQSAEPGGVGSGRGGDRGAMLPRYKFI